MPTLLSFGQRLYSTGRGLVGPSTDATDLPVAEMDQDPPPSPQVVHRVFVDSADQPLKVFVDAAVFNRVKIGRTLKVRFTDHPGSLPL